MGTQVNICSTLENRITDLEKQSSDQNDQIKVSENKIRERLEVVENEVKEDFRSSKQEIKKLREYSIFRLYSFCPIFDHFTTALYLPRLCTCDPPQLHE